MTDTSDKEDDMSQYDVEKAQELPSPESSPEHNNATEKPDPPSAIQDWDGPDDADNPMNWSTWKKAYHTGATAFLGFSVTCGSSLITPSNTLIAEAFNVSETAAILTLSLFSFGLALGPVIAAPISETLGRSVVYKTSAPIYLLFILGAGFSTSFGSLLVCRLFAGIAGAPCLAVGAGTNADMYPPHKRAMPSAFYVIMPFLGPALGPVIGGFSAAFKTWQWSQWCTIFVGLPAFIGVLFMSETYKKVILKRRAKSRGLPAAAVANVKASAQIKFLLMVTLIRPIRMLFTEMIVLLFALYNGVGFSVMFSFFAAYPYVFQSVYHLNTWEIGLLFLPLGVGVILALITNLIIDHNYYAPRHKAAIAAGKPGLDPEYRLLIGQIGSIGLPVGLFWFGWTSRTNVHWIVPALAGIPFAWANLCIFMAGALYMIDVYGPLLGSSALAANGLARYTMGGVFPLFVLAMYRNLGIGWATSVFGFITLAMMAIPFVLFTLGPRVRQRSGMTT